MRKFSFRRKEPFVAFALKSSFGRLAAAVVVVLGLGWGAAAAAEAPAPDGSVDMAKVLEPGPLPDLSMGDANGVPIVEYGSLTCPHCAAFANETLPQLKATYIDTGKVRYIFREYARNQLDVAAYILERCIGDDKSLAAVGLLFKSQDQWAFVDKPLDALIAAMRPTGLTHEKAMGCLKDQAKAKAFIDIAKKANDLVKLQGTPTFVIDGKIYGGELTLDQLKTILTPLVK
jgi:protein-disulfide isomerase